MILGSWEIILVTIITILIGGVGILIYFKNPKNRANKYFFLLTFSLLIWIDGAFLSEIPNNLKYSLFLSRLTYLGVLLFATFLFIFSFYFPREKVFIRGIRKNLFYGIVIFFSFLSLFTDLIIKDVKPTPWGFDLVFGDLSIFYILFSILLALISFKNFFQDFKDASGIEKLQLQYLFLGLVIFIGVSIIVNVIIRSLIGSDIYYRIGNYSSVFFVILLGVAVARYHLFGIELILTEILVGAIGILLLVQIFVAPTTLWKIVNGVIFVLFCIFGYLLIRGVFREIRRREELERISRAKTEFISITSHQLRTPLTVIKGYLSMILEGVYGEVSEKLKKVLDNIYLANERLIKLVNSFLNISRIELGKIELEFQETDIAELTESVVKEMESSAKEKNLYLKFEKPKELPKIFVDKEKIREVILNLIDNAIKYTQKGGVEIKLQMVNDRLRILVSDTGEGFTKEEKEKLFESFSRGSAGEKYWVEGAGVGLYIAKRIVELHQGKIWAESEGKGKGSTFFVELPLR
jgi:signal transduction histidine kinase